MIALTFIGLPFVVRTVQPVLENLEVELEEAAASLGATRWQTCAAGHLPDLDARRAHRLRARLRVARSASTGPSIFIAGNMPMKTEIAPLSSSPSSSSTTTRAPRQSPS